jgi:hypothetical protein
MEIILTIFCELSVVEFNGVRRSYIHATLLYTSNNYLSQIVSKSTVILIEG